MEKEKFDSEEIDRQEWRQLGFYYDSNDEDKTWSFFGSKEGFKKFFDRLIKYSQIEKNKIIGEHEHFGPYQYLKVITGNEPAIFSQGIIGSISDIIRFANIFQKKISNSKLNNEVIIDKEYSSKNEFKIRIIIMDDSFDPASLDKWQDENGNWHTNEH